MGFIVDASHLGTSEENWTRSEKLAALPSLPDLHPRRVIVVAPHPDDEVFGAAGLVQSMLQRSIPVEFIVVTDGEGSHPGCANEEGADLRTIRAGEMETALRRLGCAEPVITRLGLPDGHVTDHSIALTEMLSGTLFPDDLCVAPWWRDGHPDHDACGRAALAAAHAGQARLLAYLIWAWHWADPNSSDIPWKSMRRFGLNRRMVARKRWATGAYRSQILPWGPDHDAAPLLPPSVVRRFWRSFEVFVEDAEST